MTQGQLFTPETESQESRILAHLQQGKTLTQLEAISLFGCLRLGARCFALKLKGYPIESESVVVGAKRKRVAKYSLKVS